MYYAQLTDLHAVLQVVNELACSGSPALGASTHSITTLQSMANRTSHTILELQSFIDEKLKKKLGQDKNGKPSVSKRAWVRNEPKLRLLRERLRDCRLGMSLHLSIILTNSV